MGWNRTVGLLTIGLLLVTGCAKPGFEASRKKLIRNQAMRSPKAALFDAEPPQILPETHFAAGRMFEAQGDVAKAIEQYQKTIAVSHTHVAAHHRLGLIYSELGRHDAAIEMFRRAVELKPDNAVLRNNLGFELMFERDWKGALEQLTQAIRLEPDFARAHINMGMTLSRMNRFDDALAHFRTVLPETDAQYNLGLMYRAAQRYDEAAKTFEHILAVNPNFKAAKMQLAEISPRVAPGTEPEADAATPLAQFARVQLQHTGEVPYDEPKVIAPSTTRARAPHESKEPCDDETTDATSMVEPDLFEVVASNDRPEPSIVAPSTTSATVVEATTARTDVDNGYEWASPGDDAWLTDDEFSEAVEIASADDEADWLDADDPCQDEEYIGTENVFVDPSWEYDTAHPVPASDAVTSTEPMPQDDAFAAVPFGRLNDEVALIDDEIRCLVDEAIEAMAVAQFDRNASEPAPSEPFAVDTTDVSLFGNFIADTTEPVRYTPAVDLTMETMTPAHKPNELRLPADRRMASTAHGGTTVESVARTPNRPRSAHWRTRLNSLSANLTALREEIDCLNHRDAELAAARPRTVTGRARDGKPKGVRVADENPTRVQRPRPHRGEKPKMMLAYNPKETFTMPPNTPAERTRFDATPPALRRPARDTHDVSTGEIGPAFPVMEMGPAFAETERNRFDWDAQFGDLQDLLAITENEIACAEQAGESTDEEHMTDNAGANRQRYKTRVTPVRFRPRRNPFSKE